MRRSLARLLAFALLCPAIAPARPPPTTELPVWSTTQARQDRYVAAHGLRAFAGGYSEDGLEFWAPPLQIADGYRLDFALPQRDAVAGIGLLAAVEVDPLGVTRLYRGPGFEVRERIETRDGRPGARVRLRVQGPADVRLVARFRPSLDLMWPAAVGGQEMAWDARAHGFLLGEPSRRFRALIASPQATEHSQARNNDRRGGPFRRPLFLRLAPQPCGGDARCATLVFAGQSEADEDVHATADALLQADEAPAAEDRARFDFSRRLTITTPDEEVDRALRWSQIALEQAWTCNARLGCGLVAGHGPSRGARRPQYAWYFAGDGLLGTRALIAQGEYARAAQELDFILRYQHPDEGTIWHEMSHSAPFLDWARDYPYMYAHVDITFDFLGVLAEYARASGDRAFLARHWPAVLRAWRYCLSTVDPRDGLPRIPADKTGGNEQDPLGDELTLSAAWVAAARAMSELAARMGDEALSRRARAAGERARAALRPRYRDERERRWISGYSRAGAPMESYASADLAAVTLGAATAEEAARTLDRLQEPAYLTAWGLRSKPAGDADYDPDAYAKGSVWSHGTAIAAGLLWRQGRAAQAWALWRRLVPWTLVDSLGHFHEVMQGDAFEPQRESVPEQTWSSAAFLSAAIEGLLGLRSEADTRTLHFAPQLPPEWQRVRIEHVRIGEDRASLEWRRENGVPTLTVDNAGPAFRLLWSEGADAARRTVGREVPPGRTRLQFR
ncbi:MGH1-like glycoside hydrolase domain-containing protein [Vulcaniibacterium tengchongense]|uniref:Mannosylglycerate hydrolase MGH1-like glycoside hydrolase domain-containing protein n=1 Tax=Vulcaniibacterium tengchongense TaxID=1273429 RepID=A0A3N4VUZ0_9GAMM|nr:hypothetical protein [Vulcaniibacterium tengchongense]RPE76894.1 hypothetical protein EDC50_2146 [Vulcaniibacterium tengchongense]